MYFTFNSLRWVNICQRDFHIAYMNHKRALAGDESAKALFCWTQLWVDVQMLQNRALSNRSKLSSFTQSKDRIVDFRLDELKRAKEILLAPFKVLKVIYVISNEI